MLTRCPACSTRFRLQSEHIYAASGQVRCGRCTHVFDVQEQSIDLPSANLSNFSEFNWAQSHNGEAIIWKLGTLLLLLTLFGQWLWWERFWLVTKPYTEQLVTVMCKHLPCAMPPFRNLERIEILERHLETTSPGVVAFRFRMVNKAPQPQPYPMLELTLLNAETKVIGSRRFTPEQYLVEQKIESLILNPEEPVQIELKMVNPQDTAAGFEIEFW